VGLISVGGWVDSGGGRGDCVEGWFDVDRQAGEAGVAAFGHQHRELEPGLGQMCEPGVP
jgi:hypothetical protein